MATLPELRKQAKAAGHSTSDVRGADRQELERMVASKPKSSKGSKGKAVVKKVAAVAKKKSAGSKNAPAAKKSTAGKAKRRSTATATKTSKTKTTKTRKATGGSGYVPKGGRNLLSRIKFSKTDGWNAREDSAPDRIIKALRKTKGDRQAAFEILKKDIRYFVNPKMRNGTKRNKAQMEDVLKYRISRTLWDFALKTGQHDKAENRVDYGTGGTGNGTFKAAKKSARKATTAKSKTKTTTAKGNSRKASSKSKTSKRKATSKR